MATVNLKKLASILELSISTVSKALRDSYEISNQTKERVKKLAQELNYQPNPYASSLRRSKSKTIAVVVPEIANNFFVSAINGIQNAAHLKGYHVLIYISHENSNYEKELVNILINGRVDGVLISLSRDTDDVEHLKTIQNKGLPIVFFDRVSEDLDSTTITTDDYESAYKSTLHLIEKGCKKIANCAIGNNLSIAKKRVEGFKDALADNKLQLNSNFLMTCTGDYEIDYKLIKKLLLSKDRPDGLFTSIESFALIAYEICKELKIRIPQDLKIITFSNLRTANLLAPSLTTITQPAFEIGEAAALQLIKAIEKPKNYVPENIIIKSGLVERASTSVAG